MRVYLHIGLAQAGANRLHRVIHDKRKQLAAKGILVPRVLGQTAHTRLFAAVTDPDHLEPLRVGLGCADAGAQAELRATVTDELERAVEAAKPEVMILSAPQFATGLHRRGELERLRQMLTPFSDDIQVVAHLDTPARLLARFYGDQVMAGRATPLARDLALAERPDWWAACLETFPQTDIAAGRYAETEGAPFWLDLERLATFWGEVFGPVTFRSFDKERFAGEAATEELRAAFGIAETLGKAQAEPPAQAPSAAWVARARRFNALIQPVLAQGRKVLERPLWSDLLRELAIGGEPIDAGQLAAISNRFADQVTRLCAAHEGLAPAAMAAPAPAGDWSEADPGQGYRASQYLLAFMFRIDKAAREARRAEAVPVERPETPSDAARAVMPPLALQNFRKLRRSRFAPHNRLGAVNEEELAAAYSERQAPPLAEGSSGTVIVGCMKNEAPYILEWVAHHRAIGVDHFLIYTNDCSDGTAQMLDRLAELGVLTHRDNSGWKGKSPQQHALNKAMKEPVIERADWIVHIDVDEFINVRCGNGTLEDFHARVPDATNVAMTWRLFGHNGVKELEDRFVIDQFDTCAPRFCPKPHTVWGFKTMSRNIGAYGKLSCHRPNKLAQGFEGKVRWFNGSGQDVTGEMAQRGWRSSMRSIGYDLIQLNHYALRSAESFLIKRQRGRALHVDRSIGLNYWIRMDWSDVRDITIKRNIPRVRAEYDRLMQDEKVRQLHQDGLAWHRAKADELHGMPEFQELYEQALKVKLNETERVAYALALDMES